METVVLGGGCFWCTEAIFKNLKGVKQVLPGYAGGITKNPSWEQVCSGDTGHAEVSQIEFDPRIIPFADLLGIFFHTHDPTTLNQQGNDMGTEYRSIILYTSEKQRETAQQVISDLEKAKEFSDKIVTEVKPLEKFSPAENYHQNYYARNSQQPFCQFVISPKLQHLREKYQDKLKGV